MRSASLRTSIWFVTLFVLVAWMALGWMRYHPGERLHLFETPFDKTPGLEAARWRFLSQVRDVLPEGGVYTIRAATREEEMELFMLSGAVIERNDCVPASYYGEVNPGAESVQWIASFGCAVVPDGAAVVARMPDGCVFERTR